jgi:hypothetical protein
MSSTLPRKLAVAAVLALGVSALATTGAGAGNIVVIDSEIVMRETFPAFHGKVTSSNAACTQNRLVKLFKKRQNGGRKILGKTNTDLAGKWQVIVDPLKSGLYRSVVKQREEGTAGTIFVCARDKSQRVFVD